MFILLNKIGRITIDVAEKKVVVTGELIVKRDDEEMYSREVVTAVARGDAGKELSDLLLTSTKAEEIAGEILIRYYVTDKGIVREPKDSVEAGIKAIAEESVRVNRFKTLEEAKQRRAHPFSLIPR